MKQRLLKTYPDLNFELTSCSLLEGSREMTLPVLPFGDEETEAQREEASPHCPLLQRPGLKLLDMMKSLEQNQTCHGILSWA